MSINRKPTKTGMTQFDMMNRFTDIDPRDLGMSSTAKAVMYVMLRYVDANTGCTRPSVERIVKSTGTSRATVSRAIKELAEAGFIRVSKRKVEDKIYHSNIYSINLVKTLALGKQIDSIENDEPVEVAEVVESLVNSKKAVEIKQEKRVESVNTPMSPVCTMILKKPVNQRTEVDLRVLRTHEGAWFTHLEDVNKLENS